MGERIKGEVEKQFLPLAGIPIVVHTLRVFEQADSIENAVLVVPTGRVNWVEEEIIGKHQIRKVSEVLEGGAERQDSVYKGLSLVEAGIVAIHDGVRPFVRPDLVDLLVGEAEEWGAAVPAVRVTDTVKSVEEDMVRWTLSRKGMWLAQTPQVFRYELIKRAYDKANEEAYYATDDSALVERLGHGVKIVEGSSINMKITTQDDIALAEALLKMEGSG